MSFHIIWTVLMLIIFVGIFVWAFSGAQKKRFESAAALALEPDDSPVIAPPVRADQARYPNQPAGNNAGSTDKPQQQTRHR